MTTNNNQIGAHIAVSVLQPNDGSNLFINLKSTLIRISPKKIYSKKS